MQPQPGLPDLVFTANAGAVYKDKAIASHFMPHERRPEEVHYKKWFRDNGFDLLDLDEKIGFEGAGDCLFDRGGSWLWTGFGYRTEIEAHADIQKFFDVDLVSIKLTDSRFYYIDTCFCPLTGGFLMYHPPAFDFDSRIAIESRIPPHKRIIVDTMDAGNFACNAVNIGDTVILNKASRMQRMATPHQYCITPRDPGAHLFEVTVRVANPDPAGQVFSMPAWVPGSYLIRDLARHVVAIRAESDGQEIALHKTDKSSWQADRSERQRRPPRHNSRFF